MQVKKSPELARYLQQEAMARVEGSVAEVGAMLSPMMGELAVLTDAARESLDKLDAVHGDVLAVGAGVDRVEGRLDQIEENLARMFQKFMGSVGVDRQVKARDSFTAASSQNVKELLAAVDELKGLMRSSGLRQNSGRSRLLLDAGAALNSAQRPGEAVDLFRSAVEMAEGQEKALAYWNLFMASLNASQPESALSALRQAWELDPEKYLLFDAHQYEPERILGAGGMGVAFLCRSKQKPKSWQGKELKSKNRRQNWKN